MRPQSAGMLCSATLVAAFAVTTCAAAVPASAAVPTSVGSSATAVTRAALADDDVVVDVPDAALAAAIRAARSIAADVPITRGDVRALRSLNLDNAGISDLTGLEFATSLELWHLNNNSISSLEPLRGLTNIEQFEANNNPITDIGPLAASTSLNYLALNNTQISDLTPLAANTALWRIEAQNTRISDLEPLRNVTTLEELYVSRTQVSDLGPLSGMRGMRAVSAPYTQVSDLSPIAGIESMSIVNVNGCHVRDVTALATWPNLTNGGFQLQTYTIDDVALVPVGATSYRNLDAADVAVLLPGDTAEVVGLATPIAGGGGEWTDITPATTTLPVQISSSMQIGLTYSATVSYAVTWADFTNGAPAAGTVDSDYAFDFTVTTGFGDDVATPFAMTSGEIPGLTLDASGRLAGVPTTAGTYPITVQRADRHGNVVTATYDIVIDAATVPGGDPDPVVPTDPSSPSPTPTVTPSVTPQVDPPATEGGSSTGTTVLARTGAAAGLTAIAAAAMLLAGVGLSRWRRARSAR